MQYLDLSMGPTENYHKHCNYTINLFLIFQSVVKVEQYLSSFPANSSGQLNILRHYGHSLCVNGTQICVLKQSNKVGFTCFLQWKTKSMACCQIQHFMHQAEIIITGTMRKMFAILKMQGMEGYRSGRNKLQMTLKEWN